MIPFIIPLLNHAITAAPLPFIIKDYPILSKNRIELTKKYAKRHYNMDTYLLRTPKIIVIHYTALPTLRMSLGAFKADTLPSHRTKLSPYGKLNVGTHFVITRDGIVYSLLPTTVMGRHTMGYNHVAIGIENVGTNEHDLTDQQVNTNAALIAFLMAKHPPIKYVIGHQDYMNQSMPHFTYYLRKDKSYSPMIKIDPGWGFMRKVTEQLKEEYDITLN
jgi:N-acetyl-anhydromuramyl-L-alanine amidase AmpD